MCFISCATFSCTRGWGSREKEFYLPQFSLQVAPVASQCMAAPAQSISFSQPVKSYSAAAKTVGGRGGILMPTLSQHPGLVHPCSS